MIDIIYPKCNKDVRLYPEEVYHSDGYCEYECPKCGKIIVVYGELAIAYTIADNQQ